MHVIWGSHGGSAQWQMNITAGQLVCPLCSFFQCSIVLCRMTSYHKSHMSGEMHTCTLCPMWLHQSSRYGSSFHILNLLSVKWWNYLFIRGSVWIPLRSKLDKGQFGATKESCSTFSLITVVHCGFLQQKKNTKAAFLDYAKAFEHINPNILLQTLASMNIPARIRRWVEHC